MGVPSVRLEPDEIHNMLPGVRTDDISFGLYCPDDGEIDAHQIMGAMNAAPATLELRSLLRACSRV